MTRRKKKPAGEKTEFTSTEIGALGGVSKQVVQRWLKVGILPRAEFKGAHTRYSLDHARRARAIAIVGTEVATHPRFGEMVPIILGETAPAPADPAPRLPDVPGTPWVRTPLAPGLELHVSASAGPAVLALAAELIARAEGRPRSTKENGQTRE